MKIFVTGGTGFIGSHFLNQAHRAGHEVRALRRTLSSVPSLAVPKDIKWLTKPMDELEDDDLLGSEVLVHLASPGVSPQRASLSELIYWNVDVLSRLISTANAAGVRRVIVAGTFAEYGQSADRYDFIPVNAPLLPTYDYAASKAASFQIAHSLAISLGIELVYLRIFSAYGEGQYEKNFWPALVRAAKSGENFQMTEGAQIRDYIEVSEVVSHFIDWCSAEYKKSENPVVRNIGTGTPISMKTFAETWWSKFNATGKLEIGAMPYRPNEVMRFVPEV